jgi:hypothetical protein
MNMNVKVNENVGRAAGSGCCRNENVGRAVGSGCCRKWAVSNALILSYCFVNSICYFSYAM